jgi:hypothetical protein
MLSTISLLPVIDRMSSLHICCVPGKATCQFSACTYARTVCLKSKLHAFPMPHVVQKKNTLLILSYTLRAAVCSSTLWIYLFLFKWISQFLFGVWTHAAFPEAEFLRRHLNLHFPASVHCMDLNSSQASGLGALYGCACTIKLWMFRKLKAPSPGK